MGNVVFSALLLIFGVIYYLASARIPSNMLEDPVGASGFPRLVAASILVLSAILLAQSSIGWRKARLAAANRGGTGPTPGVWLRSLAPAALLFVTIVLFLAVFEHLGYLLSVMLFLLTVFLQRGTRFGWMPVATAVAGAICFHLFFGELLNVRLPDGLLSLPV